MKAAIACFSAESAGRGRVYAASMINPRRLLALLLLAVLPLAKAAEPPQQMLQVELRWVESSISAAALAGNRQGAVVVGTGGSVSPRGGQVLSTRPADAGVGPMQRLMVLNGRSASALMSEPRRLEYLDWGVQSRQGKLEPQAQSRSVWVERQTGVQLKVTWPGGARPALLELRTLLPRGEAGSEELISSLLVPLEHWTVVAREGGNPQPPPAGTYSSRDAEPQPSRELQVRISRAPE